MLNKSEISEEKRDISLSLVTLLLAALFIAAPLYSTKNIGGLGLSLTYNIPLWAVASWIIATACLMLPIQKTFTYPSLWPYFIFFPLIIILSSLGEIGQPITWLFRQLYILGGLAFLLSLFQFSLTQRSIDKVLWIIVFSTGCQALLGTFQTIGFDSFSNIFLNPGLTPRGNFQQVNVLTTFLVTGIVSGLYLISRPSFRTSSKLTKALHIVSLSLAIYVVFASGSRIGLLTLILSTSLLVISRYKCLQKQKQLLVVLVITSCLAGFLGQAGLYKTIDKAAKTTEESYSGARFSMYTIGLELISKEPINGYGIGGFKRAWNPQSSDYINRHPEIYLPNTLNHPHNEILFWMIEGGLISVVGIFIVVFGIGIGLYRCGFQRGGAYAAMLLPISLHTQVELPFYTSAVHWFLWLFLVFLVLRHQTKSIKVNTSQMASRFLQITAISLSLSTTLFMINTARAQDDLYRFLYDKNVQPPYLQKALNNLYFRTTAERIAMRSNLYANIESNNSEGVANFVTWAEDYVSRSPELKMYEDLISASVYLNPVGKGCDRIIEALAMYAHNKPLQQAKAEKCD